MKGREREAGPGVKFKTFPHPPPGTLSPKGARGIEHVKSRPATFIGRGPSITAKVFSEAADTLDEPQLRLG
ncbi:hypothetical protein GMSM_02300 [Geomonas sp. Red276]